MLVAFALLSLQKVYKANYEKSRGFSINYCDTPKFQMDSVLKQFNDVRINPLNPSHRCVRLSGILWQGSILQSTERIYFIYEIFDLISLRSDCAVFAGGLWWHSANTFLLSGHSISEKPT